MNNRLESHSQMIQKINSHSKLALQGDSRAEAKLKLPMTQELNDSGSNINRFRSQALT